MNMNTRYVPLLVLVCGVAFGCALFLQGVHPSSQTAAAEGSSTNTAPKTPAVSTLFGWQIPFNYLQNWYRPQKTPSKWLGDRPTSGASPLTVQFNNVPRKTSKDFPAHSTFEIIYGDKQRCSYTFADLSTDGKTACLSHTYQSAGTYTAILRVKEGANNSTESRELGRITIIVNTARETQR